MWRSRVSNAWPMPGCSRTVSFGARVYDTWPTALAAARDYTFGTLIQAPRALPLIDSGYLTYYLQGKWLFVAAVAGAARGPVVAGSARVLRPAFAATRLDDPVSRIFLTGALIISNPLRSPLVISFVVFSLWRLTVERGATVLQIAATDTTLPLPSRGTSAAHSRRAQIECLAAVDLTWRRTMPCTAIMSRVDVAPGQAGIAG